MKNLVIWITIVLNGLCLHVTQGVRCWTCENAISNKDCIQRGRSVECFGEGIGCSSEVRYHAGFVFKIQIRKGCKQILACGSDKSQNGHGWYPVQCNPKYPDSICRCCCQTDDCNTNLIGCEPPQPECLPLDDIENGIKTCDSEKDGTSLRTICTFSCNAGYELRGEYKTQCILAKSGLPTWTEEEPQCSMKKCKPFYRNTPSRKVKCTNKNYAFSICTFNCVDGYVMNGEIQSTCLEAKNWDYPPPDCVKITCPPPKNPPAYSEMSCTNGEEFGSVCEYSCFPGHVLLGESKTECVLSNSDITSFGVWSNDLPQCLAIICPSKQMNPQHGQVECTDMNYEDSTCSFVCKEGYKLEGNSTTTCIFDRKDTQAKWTSDQPICSPIRCTEIFSEDSNSHVSCSNINNVGSICAFACNEGAYIKSMTKRIIKLNQLTLTCLSDGTWSEELATCSKIECFPKFSDIQNGGFQCTDDNNYKSQCKFFCDEGYDLKGSKRSICKDGRSMELPGVWSDSQPRCARTGCKRQQKTDEKMKVSCTNRYLFGSVCDFSCKKGYYMTSAHSEYIEKNTFSIECTQERDWTGPTPVCKHIHCLPDIRKLSNGVAKCTNKNYYNSRCTFICSVGYGLVGESRNYCSDDKVTAGVGTWTNKQPTCVRNGCAPIFSTPANGKMSCTNKNLFRSTCKFSCRDGYYMASFENYLVETRVLPISCSNEGNWGELPPTCHPITCKELDKNVDHGNVTCTDGNRYKSQCKYSCGVGYEVNKPSETAECTDTLTINAYGVWSQEETRCIRASCTVRQRAPQGGKVACTSGNGVGSVCKFECYDGHYMSNNGDIASKNEFHTRCEKNKRWNFESPECLPVTCPKNDLPNGDVSCQNDNIYLSQCKFSCLPGFMLIGTNSSACRADGDTDANGMWSKKWPVCRELGCDANEVNNPDNGLILCSDGAKLRSTCELICERGYKRVGGQFTICRRESETVIAWSKPLPRCVAIK